MLSHRYFLPGASGNVEMWRELASTLPPSGPEHFVTWPGFGTAPAEPHINGLGDLVARLANQIGSQPSDILAQSMGGVIAVRAALQLGPTLRRLVLCATSGGIDVQALGAVDWRPILRGAHPELPPWFEEPLPDMSEGLADLGVSTLLLWGDNDPIAPIAIGERLRELIPCSRLVVIDGADHDLIGSHAEQAGAHVREHLEPTPLDSVFHLSHVDKLITTSGFVPPRALDHLAAAGYEAVINLLPEDNRQFIADEGDRLHRAGLTYHQLPVDFEAPQLADFADFRITMNELIGRKLWIHCAANYRVTTSSPSTCSWSAGGARSARNACAPGYGSPTRPGTSSATRCSRDASVAA